MDGEEDKGLTADGSLWWLSKEPDDKGYGQGEEVARNVTRVCESLETATIPRRWRNYCYYRYFTGEPYSAQFAYGMAARPMGFLEHYGSFEFEPARYNLIGVTSDVYVNRLLSHKSVVTLVPEHGNYEQRQTSVDLEGWVEGGWDETGYWRERLAMGIHGLCYGSGYLLWDEGLDHKIRPEAVDPNEMLFPNYDDPNPQWCMRRVWVSREDMMDRYGTTPERRAAIRHAPNAHPAFWFEGAGLATEDIIPLIRAWRTPHVNGKAGRDVLVIGGIVLHDKKYVDPELPVIRWDFHQKPSSCIGQGIPALLLEINQAVDELLSVMQESDARAGMGKWFYSDASGVNPDALGDTIAAAVQYTAGTGKPEYQAIEPIGQYCLDHIKLLIDLGMKRVHISELAIQGEQPRALTSAIALERWSQIDDMNFLELIGRLEEVDRKSALAMIRLGKRLKPSYTFVGSDRQIIDWENLVIDGTTVKGVRAYNTGRFGQSVSAKLQELDVLLAKGSITRDMYNKYLEVPDMGGLLQIVNAPMTGADRQISKMLRPDGEYEPPLPFLNKTYAKSAVEAQYIIQEGRGTPQEYLDRLLQWRAAVIEMIEEETTPDPNQPANAAGPVPAIPKFGASANMNPAYDKNELPIQPIPPTQTSAVAGALQ